MSRLIALFLLPLAAVTDFAMAADGATRPLNWNAIGMFLVFVLFTPVSYTHLTLPTNREV